MSNLNNNDINDAKRRVEEMHRRARRYVGDASQEDEKCDKEHFDKKTIKSKNPDLFGDFVNSIFSSNNSEDSVGLILALILILSKEGADNKLIFALLYILL